MAYPPKMAAALSGATLRQLRYWRREQAGPLLVPEVAVAPRVLYSFRDVLALRTFVRLRETAPLQRVRRAIASLRDLGNEEHLAAYGLAADGEGNIYLIEDGQASIDLVRRPGQMLLISMFDVLAPFGVRGGVVVPHLLRPRDHLAVDPETQGGIPVIAGTRVPYDSVAGLMREGVPPEQVKTYYPAVTSAAARDALDFARYVDSYGAAHQAA